MKQSFMKKNNLIFITLVLLLQSLPIMCTQKPYIVYFAGALFDHKQLTGNTMLAKKIESLYKDRYQCILPQDMEVRSCSSVEIRNHDIMQVMCADLAIFNFDGTELDSGTVVEFMIAKMLDIPSVILRTDFRNSGDTKTVCWNLMATGYPRTQIVNHNCWISYSKGINQMHQEIAHAIHQAFEIAIATPTVFTSKEELLHAYSSMLRLCGSDLSNCFSKDQVTRIVQSKIEKGLYRFTTH